MDIGQVDRRLPIRTAAARLRATGRTTAGATVLTADAPLPIAAYALGVSHHCLACPCAWCMPVALVMRAQTGECRAFSLPSLPPACGAGS